MQYIVVTGDTLYLIAQKFGISLYQLIVANPQITNTNYLFVGQVINIPLPSLYVIKPGDTITSIAARFKISPSLILDANPHITNPDRIMPGIEIVIPSSSRISIHIVMQGDTLLTISQKYSTKVSDILKLNTSITNANLIYPGQKIFVPLPPPLKSEGCILFTSNLSGKNELWVSSAMGDKKEQITGKSSTSPYLVEEPYSKWSPDGKYLAFLANGNTNISLYIIKPPSKKEIKLAENANRFSWSNSGNKIAFSNEEGTFIATMDGSIRKVSDKLYNPVWYPGDKTLFGYTYNEAFTYEIMGSVDITGENFKAYTDPIIPADSVSISPNGRYIAISAFTGSPYYVTGWVSIYDINSKTVVLLPGTEFTFNGTNYNISILGGWSPDSTRLVYNTIINPNGYSEIKIATHKGAILKNYGRGYYAQTQWGKESELILFVLSEYAGNSPLTPTKPRNIFILNTITNMQHKLTRTGDNFSPDWRKKSCPAFI